MFHRGSSIVATAWALWGMPLLCVAGVLEHPCAPQNVHGDGGVEHRSPSEREGSHDGDCGHESDCGADPCQQDFPRLGWSAEVESSFVVPLFALGIAVDLPSTFVFSKVILCNTPLLGVRLPMPLSDLPLIV